MGFLCGNKVFCLLLYVVLIVKIPTFWVRKLAKVLLVVIITFFEEPICGKGNLCNEVITRLCLHLPGI